MLGPSEAVVGLVTDFALAMLFGIVFAFAVQVLGLAHRLPLLVAVVLLYGLALYGLNFQVIGRAAFPWFVNSNRSAPGLRTVDPLSAVTARA